MIPRPRLSTETPQMSARDAARWRLLIEPAERRRSSWSEARTVGDVLDTPAPERCLVRSRWYSPDREEGGTIAKACESKQCPFCVVAWLGKTAGRAWASWISPVTVERFETSGAWEWARRSRGIKMQGSEAASGVLDLPNGGDARLVFIPDPSGLRGPELDAAVVEGVRAVPVAAETPAIRGATEPSPTFGFIPSWISNARAVELAEQAGLVVKIRGEQQMRYRGTLRQTQVWVDLMRSA